jgi:hypothetical protein
MECRGLIGDGHRSYRKRVAGLSGAAQNSEPTGTRKQRALSSTSPTCSIAAPLERSDRSFSALITSPACRGDRRASLSKIAIPCSRHHPKILRIDDTEIVGDRIAEFGPVARHFFAQEIERRIGELRRFRRFCYG